MRPCHDREAEGFHLVNSAGGNDDVLQRVAEDRDDCGSPSGNFAFTHPVYGDVAGMLGDKMARVWGQMY